MVTEQALEDKAREQEEAKEEEWVWEAVKQAVTGPAEARAAAASALLAGRENHIYPELPARKYPVLNAATRWLGDKLALRANLLPYGNFSNSYTINYCQKTSCWRYFYLLDLYGYL